MSQERYDFVDELDKIQQLDQKEDYEERNKRIYRLLYLAKCMPIIEAGIRYDKENPEWPVAYFELPEGQIAYHIKEHPKEYDGHSTEQKNERINKFLNRLKDAVIIATKEEIDAVKGETLKTK